jgi:hypothetical protein
VRHDLRKGRGDTEPGIDDIDPTFLTVVRESLHGELLELFNQMFSAGAVTAQQKGLIVCIPRTASPKYPQEYRSVTLLKIITELWHG